MYKNGVRSYRETNVITADPKKLILMCYEGAIDSLKLGKQKIIEKDYEGKGKALTKTQNIIEELLRSLDFEKGGSIAKNLESLYHYMLRRLLQANLNKDIEAIDEVITMLSELQSAWEEIFQTRGGEIQPPATNLGEERRPQLSGYVGI